MTIGFKEQVIVTIEVWPTCMHNKDPTIIILILNDNLKTSGVYTNDNQTKVK